MGESKSVLSAIVYRRTNSLSPYTISKARNYPHTWLLFRTQFWVVDLYPRIQHWDNTTL